MLRHGIQVALRKPYKMTTMNAMPQDEQENALASADAPQPVFSLASVDSQTGPEPNPTAPNPVAIETKPQPRGIAPIWHTAVLVLGIIGFSAWGAMSANSGSTNPFAP